MENKIIHQVVVLIIIVIAIILSKFVI